MTTLCGPFTQTQPKQECVKTILVHLAKALDEEAAVNTLERDLSKFVGSGDDLLDPTGLQNFFVDGLGENSAVISVLKATTQGNIYIYICRKFTIQHLAAHSILCTIFFVFVIFFTAIMSTIHEPACTCIHFISFCSISFHFISFHIVSYRFISYVCDRHCSAMHHEAGALPRAASSEHDAGRMERDGYHRCKQC